MLGYIFIPCSPTKMGLNYLASLGVPSQALHTHVDNHPLCLKFMLGGSWGLKLAKGISRVTNMGYRGY